MAKDFEVRSVIACDDIREEAHGKVSLLGVLDNEVIIPAFPALLHKLAFRVAVKVLDQKPDELHISIDGDKGTTLFKYDGPLPSAEKFKTVRSDNFAVTFAIANVLLQQEETFHIRFGFSGKVRDISQFAVRMPMDEEEKRRIEN